MEIPRRGRLMPIRVKPWLALGATLVLALSAAGLAWNHRIASDPARLIARAYTQQRPFEFRIAGAGHAAVRLERGSANSRFQRPADLLEAEARIARELQGDPDNVKWLALRGRAELLGWDAETSVATLQHAQEQKPDDAGLLADLGAAYALRAESQNRAVDYGYAIEYLSRSLKAKPDAPEALFNRAVVYERMYLYDDGVREWRRFLEVERSARVAGRGAAPAKRTGTEEEGPADGPGADLRSSGSCCCRGSPAVTSVEPESYLDVAITEWLPRRSDDPNYERALNALAAQFQKRHGDPWLRDVLAAPRSRELVRGLAALAEALRGNLADESEKALTKAPEASRSLRSAGNRAGALRADVEHVYALHRAVETAAECVEQAVGGRKKCARDELPLDPWAGNSRRGKLPEPLG